MKYGNGIQFLNIQYCPVINPSLFDQLSNISFTYIQQKIQINRTLCHKKESILRDKHFSIFYEQTPKVCFHVSKEGW